MAKDDIFHDADGEPLWDTDIQKLNEEQDRKKQLALRQWKEDFMQTFTETPAGRRVLWWLMHETFMFRTTTQFNAAGYGVLAKQQLGGDILSVIGTEALLESLIQVKKENQLQKQEAVQDD